MDESALLASARRGDLDAFNALVLAYQTQIYNLAYRVLDDEAAAADATQQTFISAYRHIGGYRGGSFRAWLLRIATNACYDELRRRKRRPAVSLDRLEARPDGQSSPETLLATSLLAGDAESPEAQVARRELAEAIQRCLDALPDEQRLVVVMADVQGYDYAEIAGAVNAALGTIKSRLSRARARLRDCLQSVRELLPAAYRLEEETAA